MTEFKNTEQQLLEVPPARRGGGAVRVRLLRADRLALSVSCRSGTSASTRCKPNENRISVAPIVPNRGIITDRNGVVLAKNYSAYTLEITPSKLERHARRSDRQSRAGRPDRRTRPPPLQEAARRLEELRKPADPHPPDRRGSRALHRAALPLSRRRSARAPVPPISARADGGARDRLYRPDFAARPGTHRRRQRPERQPIRNTTIRVSTRTTTRAPTTSARSASSRVTRPSCTA